MKAITRPKRRKETSYNFLIMSAFLLNPFEIKPKVLCVKQSVPTVQSPIKACIQTRRIKIDNETLNHEQDVMKSNEKLDVQNKYSTYPKNIRKYIAV